MKYEFVCEEDHTTTIEMPMKDDIPQEIECETCGKPAKQDMRSKVVIIPDYMKSGGLSDRDNGANLSYIKDRMKNSPTGRRKIYHRGGLAK